MPAPSLDPVRIVETLNIHAVDFVVVGGFAIELWDVAVPPTVDIDITPERSSRNLDRLAKALNDLDAEIRFGDEAVTVSGGFTRKHIEDMMTLNLMTAAGPVDITVVPAGTGGFDDLIETATEFDYQGIAVPVADLTDIARSKEAAGRPKDIQVLPAIRSHLERLGRG